MGVFVLIGIQLVGLFLFAREVMGNGWLFVPALLAVVAAFVLVKRKKDFEWVNWAIWIAALVGIGAAVTR